MPGNEKRVEIAILGWGSLLWEGGREFDDWHDEWQYDGPNLKVEFSRVSNRRMGALTLVIDEECGSPMIVAWCRSKRRNIEDAICDLRGREDTTIGNIGRVILDEHVVPSDKSQAVEDPLVTWARAKKLDAVIWTALKSNFAERVGQPFSLATVIAYVKTLSVEGKVKAAEYVWRSPAFVQTPVRSALQQEPWFSNPRP
jgi:hypothetical protein